MNKYQEALGFLRSEDVTAWGKENIDKLRKSIEVLQELVDKSIPKKPVLSNDWKDEEQTDIYDENGFINPIVSICPNCKNYGIYDFEYGQEFDYCKRCGQAIDWSDEE